jgi:hypothetical protein
MTLFAQWRDAIRARLIDDVHRAWKLSSVWAVAISAAIAEVWNTIPDSLRAHFPPWVTTAAPIVMAIAIIVARITKPKDTTNG